MKKKDLKLIGVVVAVSTIFTALAGCSSIASTAENSTPSAAVTSPSESTAIDLNSMKLDDIIANAKQEGEVNSAGMPDSWANWGETWTGITAEYGLKHTDVDMSSAEELALFESEKSNATKDIGDVGMSFGPKAVDLGLTIPYKTTYWDSIPDWAKDKDGNWIIAYYGTVSIIVNTDLVKESPKSFADILNGDYKVTVGDVTKASQAQCALLAAAVANGGSETNIQPGIDYFQTLAKQNRLDLGELSLARLQKGEIAVAFLWDYNALGYLDQIKAANPNANYVVTIPSDGSVQSGYCTVINAYAKHPYAAALTREFILSDEGQINLAKGYAKPVRDVTLPADVSAKLLPNSEYAKARLISDQTGWAKTVETLPQTWQDSVIAFAS